MSLCVCMSGHSVENFRVADPHSFHPHPDPIRIQSFNDPKIEEKDYSGKNNFLDQKLHLTYPLGLHKERPSYRRSLQLSKVNIQHFKT
jgi:hypothetical protein